MNRKGNPVDGASQSADGRGNIVQSKMHRETKPRHRGLTMIIDKGLGLSNTAELLELAADYIDYIKFAFGTTLLYPPNVLRRKLEMIAQAGVFSLPGGTLLELANYEGTTAEFFDMARRTGFTHVEVSDGTTELSRTKRSDLIRRAKDLGFHVLSEVGKKDVERPLDASYALEQIALDLADGADKVIIEARDSGEGIGVFDGTGALRDELFEDIAAGLSRPEDVMWEAPRTSQQQALLVRLGPYVNFGNVQPPDVITLEAMRRGLRGDTLRLRLEQRAPAWA